MVVTRHSNTIPLRGRPLAGSSRVSWLRFRVSKASFTLWSACVVEGDKLWLDGVGCTLWSHASSPRDEQPKPFVAAPKSFAFAQRIAQVKDVVLCNLLGICAPPEEEVVTVHPVAVIGHVDANFDGIWDNEIIDESKHAFVARFCMF